MPTPIMATSSPLKSSSEPATTPLAIKSRFRMSSCRKPRI